MTIHEVEARTGLPRANIRFYESEGLITPARENNGYRNYSDTDVEKLEKIKLLRALDISIDDIRRLDGDGVSFSEVLEKQLSALHDKLNALERTGEVMRQMVADGAEYATLDAGHYLAELEKPKENFTPAPVRVPEETPTYPRPGAWRRYFARTFDFALYTLPVEALLILTKHNVLVAPATSRGLKTLLSALITMAMALLLEPLFLHFWGTTPGKWLLGIRVAAWRKRDKLSWFDAFLRTASLLVSGYGLFIPLLSLYLMNKWRKRSNEGDDCPWEDYSELVLVDSRSRRTVAYLAAYAVYLAIAAVLTLFVPQLAPNRGDLTPAKLAENYNYYTKTYYSSFDYVDLLDENLNWTTEREQNNPSAVYIDLGGNTKPVITCIEEDGRIASVTMTYHAETDGLYTNTYVSAMKLLTYAFFGAQKSYSLFSNDLHTLRELSGNWQENHSFTMYGINVNYEVDYRSSHIKGNMIVSFDGTPAYIDYTYTMTLAG